MAARKGGWRKDCKGAGMPRPSYNQQGPERLGHLLGAIFLAAVLALFLYGYLPHFL